jgi:5-methylcytosine-specific restriction endonuclease McrA
MTYEPLSIVSCKRGLVLVMKGKASILTEHPTLVMHTSSHSFALPTQIVLKEMVKNNARNSPVMLSQRNLFVRDMYRCQYCLRHRSELKDNEFLTRDHVIPQTFGGLDVWTNVVTACNRCNHKKGHKKLSECGLTLASHPRQPSRMEIWGKRGAKMNHDEIGS